MQVYHGQLISNYWDRGDKVGAQFFTRDMLNFLLPEIKIKEITFLDKETAVVKITLEDESEIGVLQEFQYYHDQKILERLWEDAVLLNLKHKLTILPILVDCTKNGHRENLEPVAWEKRPMLEMELKNDTVVIDTFSCLVFRVNCMRDTEILYYDKPGLWTLLPFTQTQMSPAEMLEVILKRRLKLEMPKGYIEKVITQLGYYLYGMHDPNEFEEFDETLESWEQMSRAIKHVVRQWREEGKIKCAREDIVVVLEERFGAVDNSIKEQLDAKEDLEILKSLLRKSVKVASIEDFKKLL